MARWLPVPGLWLSWCVAPRRRSTDVLRVQWSLLGDLRHDLRPDPHTVDGVVRGCWLFSTGKDGIAALSLQRTLEIGSYQTAWSVLHRLRAVLVGPGRDRLSGMVEVDDAYIGAQEPGLPGGRARGKKVVVGVAVEVREPKGMGRCRIAPLSDSSGASLHGSVTDHVEAGTMVITDGWRGYSGLTKLGYQHDKRSQRAARARGEDPGQLLPAVHQVISLAKRWLLGTHHGAVEPAHLTSYLNEFVSYSKIQRNRLPFS